MEGVISSIADFGAFVDLGGADGLIHLSELSWNRVSHPNEVVKVGDRVKVQILTVDADRRRIGLSLRRLTPQPWEMINNTYEVGQVVQGPHHQAGELRRLCPPGRYTGDRRIDPHQRTLRPPGERIPRKWSTRAMSTICGSFASIATSAAWG
jgi:transcriptional accessory protein Tex/SPT6